MVKTRVKKEVEKKMSEAKKAEKSVKAKPVGRGKRATSEQKEIKAPSRGRRRSADNIK